MCNMRKKSEEREKHLGVQRKGFCTSLPPYRKNIQVGIHFTLT